MAGLGLVRRAGEAAIVAALLLTGLPSPVAAGSAAIVLTEDAHSALTADLDGDGAKEIVAIVSLPEPGSSLRVAVWGVRGGRWVSLGEEPVVRWVEADVEARTARLGEDTAALLSLRDGDRVRVVVAVGTPYTDTNPGACCLSFANVRLQGTSNLDLELVPEELGSVESMSVIDMEGDGRDELLVTAYGSSLTEASRPQYTLLRSPSGDGFVAEPVPIPNDQPVWFSSAGESDGTPGDDLLFVHEGLRRLVRVTSRDGALVAEQAPAIDILQPPGTSWIVGAADGVLLMSSERGIGTARWPRDGALGDVTEQERETWPTLYLLGTGEDARIVELTGTDVAAASDLGIRVFTLALDLEVDIDAPQEMKDLWAASQSATTTRADVLPNFYPQMGPIPGGLPDGRAAFLGLGRLLEMDPGGDHVAREVASLAGGEVVGLAGPDSAWLAFGSGWFRGGGTSAWLGDPGFAEGGFPDDARVTVAPLDSVLGPGANADPPVELAGATALDLRDGPMLFTGDDGFQATVSGEPGTLVVTSVGPQTQADEIGNGPLTITLEPSGTRAPGREHDVSMIVVSPGGFARTFGWDLTVLSEPPGLTAATSFELFDGRASVVGSVGVGTTVTVDGHSVYVTEAGDFGTVVEASIWPHDVMVVARDPLGNEHARRLEVVGFADIRALPWIPIMAALTVGAGVLLFLRTPVVRRADGVAMDGDGRLEEIDGDLA
jgi:hypothetical protein